MPDDTGTTSPYAHLADYVLRNIAQHHPPSDPQARGELAAELRRRAMTLRVASTQPDHAGGGIAHAVVVTDIDMPFFSMVGFMVKWALASIPALIIMILLGFAVGAVLGGLGIALRGL